MRTHSERHASPPGPLRRAADRFSGLRIAWPNWREPADWARDQEKLRAAERGRFAQERLRLELEALWAAPAFSR
jgi:hypothetical protein